MKKKLNKESLCAFFKLIIMDRASLFGSIAFLNGQKKRRNFNIDDIYMRGLFLRPEEYLLYSDYLESALELNPAAFSDCLRNKRELFRRIPECMGREWLDLEAATDSEIIRFVRKNGKVVMKKNLYGGKGFRVLNNKDSDEAILELAHEPGTILAEQYIRQHPALNAVYPDAVNTMRIHTIRDSDGVKVALNAYIRFGACHRETDNIFDAGEGYVAMLDHDGHCMISVKKKVSDKTLTVCRRHSDTGYTFANLKVPYYREAEELCLSAALKIPEQRYIGWDIAVTETGPVIVEGNSISVCMLASQSMSFLHTGHGNGNEWRKVLSDGMEGVEFDLQPGVFFSAELKAGSSGEEQFLILLAGWLARTGYRFVKSDNPKINSYIKISEGVLELNIIGSISRFELPEIIPADIFKADKLAKRYYEEIIALK